MENGKWVHMMDSAHTGFRNWDDNDWTYPQIRMVNPIPRGKIVVSFRGNSALERTGIFMENEGCICMDASHFTKKADVKGGSFEVRKRLGRTSDAIKSFPVTKNWEKEKNRPYVEYDFYSEEGGEYELHLYLAPPESYFSV